MRIVRIFTVLLFVFAPFVAQAQSASAPSVTVRGGAHEEYSRLVFDWPSVPRYEAVVSNDAVEVRFQSPGKLDISGVNVDGLRNVSAVSVLSESPLSVRIEISGGNRVRDFLAGSRLVLDIYNGKDAPAAVQAPPPVEQPKKAEPPEAAKNVPAAAGSSQDKELEFLKSQIEQLNNDSVIPPSEEDLAPAQEGEEDGDSQDISDVTGKLTEHQAAAESASADIGTNLVTVSSTKAASLGIFEHAGKIWIVNNAADTLLSPQVSGPNAQTMLPVSATDVAQGKLFQVKSLPGGIMKGQGGGLLWRLIISEKPSNAEPIAPLRSGTDGHGARGAEILWPLQEPQTVIDLPDPATGKTIKAVTVLDAKQFSGPSKDFVDFTLLNSPVGLAILPKVDDLNVEITEEGVKISRPGGLALSAEDTIAEIASLRQAQDKREQEGRSSVKNVYDFKNWQIGGVDALNDNENIVMSTLGTLTKEAQIEGLITLARMYLSNGMWAEALGFIEYAEAELPELASNPDFKALTGATYALGWNSEEAFKLLSDKDLEAFEEIGFWRAFALADLGDWQQATEVLPQNIDILANYPDEILGRLAPVLAEIFLRSGDMQTGEDILGLIAENKNKLSLQQQAYFDYLKGEAARQRGDVEATKKFWEPLTTGPDDLYRAKAGLALARLLLDEKEIDSKKAIDRLERLRYSWRGDELEGQINYWLGKTYFEAGEHVKGLNIMREAAEQVAGTELGRRITSEMTNVFAELFIGPDLEKLSPLEAAALYEQFSELLPLDARGDEVAEKLAEHLVKGELLTRAAKLLEYQLNHRAGGLDAFRVGTRLAAIQLLDKEPDKAVEALNKTSSILQVLPEELQTESRFREISMLRARALSQQGKPEQAIAFLNDLGPSPNVNRLRADIAWNAGYWDDAGEALADVIIDENISLTRPLEKEQAALILHRAVALNLAGDRVGLANMREKYSDAMAQTERARVFEVITRPRQSSALADRETLMSIMSEVDLFSDFLNSYKTPPKESN